MKKLLAIVLALTLVLSLGAAAWATDTAADEEETKKEVKSPVKTVTVDDLPATTDYGPVPVVPAEEEEEAKIIENEDLTEEQQKTVDAALEEVVKEGFTPVEALMVEAEGEAKLTITIEGEENPEELVVFVIYPDGTVKQFAVKDLVKLADGTYELPVDGDCVVVIAKKA